MAEKKADALSSDVYEALVAYFNRLNRTNQYCSAQYDIGSCIQNKRRLILWQLHETETINQPVKLPE